MANYIWTNHASERIRERKVPQSFIYQTLNSPDEKINSQDGSIKLHKKFGIQKTTAIIKVNEKNENVILSFWVDPPNLGTEDYKKRNHYNQMKKAGITKKILLTIKRQLGF